MFLGEYRHTLDAKGRVALPVKFRDELGEKFYVSRGTEKYIAIYPEEQWQLFCAKLEERVTLKQRSINRFFNSKANDDSFDAQGRIVINAKMKEYAELDKEIVIIGNRTHVEIWSAKNWEDEEEKFNNEDILEELIKIGF